MFKNGANINGGTFFCPLVIRTKQKFFQGWVSTYYQWIYSHFVSSYAQRLVGTTPDGLAGSDGMVGKGSGFFAELLPVG
jgi:hypothetical protein